MLKNPITVIALAMGFGLIATLILLAQRKAPEAPAPLPEPLAQQSPLENNASRVQKSLPAKTDDEIASAKNPADAHASQLIKQRSANPKKLLSEDEKRQLTLALPSTEIVRAEVKSDPHNTPPTLIRFSSEMGAKMELAEQSETTAHFFFTQLQKCALGGGKKGLTSLQALCLSDAQTLGGKFDSLGEESRKLFLRANPEAVKLSRLLQP